MQAAGSSAHVNRPAPLLVGLSQRLIPDGARAPVDTEAGQAMFRLRCALLVALGVAMAAWWMQPERLLWHLGPLLTYLAFAYAWLWIVARQVGRASVRQWIALLLDHSIIGWGLWQGGIGSGAMIWAPVTVSIGHGLRFGVQRGMLSAALGGVIMLAITQLSPHWHQAPDIRIGLALSTLIGPIYATRLAQSLQGARASAQHLAQALAHEAQHDHLTGLLNRSGLEQAFLQRSDADGYSRQPLGVLYLDLDGFKQVNDLEGHERGDQILRTVSTQLRMKLRASDHIARLGGDEFVVLLPDPGDRPSLEMIATKLLQAVTQARHQCRLDLPLSVSIGVCMVGPGARLQSALRAADLLMYEAKRMGKSQHHYGEWHAAHVPHTGSPDVTAAA